MTVGGFPRAIAEFLQRGRVGDAFFEDISAWLHRDIDMNAPQESISRLTSVLHERSAGPLNQARLVGTLGLSSRSSLAFG